MALGPEEMDAAVLRNLAGKTGKDLDFWFETLRAAGPFKKPAALVAWLKAEHGLGHVTAQIIARKWRDRDAPASQIDPIDAALGREGAQMLRRMHDALAVGMPDLQMMPRKAYVGLGTPVQFAVASRPRVPGPCLWLALLAQDRKQEPLKSAPRIGGSDRFRLLLEVEPRTDLDKVLAHLRAAASSRSPGA